MKRGKRGQFYILAAMIIVVLIAGFATINNYARREGSVQLYDFGDELGIESSKVVDYGVSSTDDLSAVINDFTSKYDEYAGEDRDIYFIFGNRNLVKLITYDDVILGNVNIAGANPIFDTIEGKQIAVAEYTPECTRGNICEVKVKIGDDIYDFELKPGENFYFIISQIAGDEQVVIQG